ncbi:MAG: peptidoglycan-binding domain-containing protein, partial [Oscillospiraceae bacterium]
YVLTTTHGTYKPEQLFFIDPKFTNVVNSKGLCFKTLLSNPYIFNEPKKYITKGDKGISVQWVQYELVRLCYNIGGGIDGRCGPITTEAIRKFQKNHGLVSDGKAGPLTREAMANA